MLVPIAITLHFLAAVIWVGGMFFAYMALRPVAAKLLEPPQRLTLWSNVFARFFPWVWGAIITLPATGYILIYQTWGGFSHVSIDIHLMHIIGWIMIFIFLHVYFAPYKQLSHAVAAKTFEIAGKKLNQIRKLIAINLMLGLIVVIIATAGRHI